MKEILVARNALDANLISSAVVRSVATYGHPLESMIGWYSCRMASCARSESAPTTILVGRRGSATAWPSRRNSGLEGHVEIRVRCRPFDRLPDPFPGPDGDGRLLGKDHVAPDRRGEIPSDAFHVLEV